MAKPRKIVELVFPVGGLARNVGFQHQPPYQTPYCLNVRPFDPIETRQRGGARFGLVKAYPTRCGTGPIQMLGLAQLISTAGARSALLLAVAGGVLYENSTGDMASVSGSLNSSAKRLQAAQIGTKVYIANYRPVNLTGTAGTIASASRLSDASLTDTVLDTIDVTKDVVWISGSVDNEENVFPITSVTHGSPGYLTFNGTMTNQVGGVTWQVGRVPKVFDVDNPTAALSGLMAVPTAGGIPHNFYSNGYVSITNGIAKLTGSGASWYTPVNLNQYSLDGGMVLTIPNQSGIGTTDYAVLANSVAHPGPGATESGLTLLDTTADADCTNSTYKLSWNSDYYGVPPLNCPLCCNYRGRLVLAGPGPVFYMSRVLNPNDWDYGFDPADPARAVFGGSETTGGVPEAITALMPHSDQYLIFGCERSLWLLTSDLAYGGTITALSRKVGVIGADAWCNTPDGSIIFLSREGLYRIAPGGQSYPEEGSRPLLPAELLNVAADSNTISLSYDIVQRGIHISVTPTSGAAGTHYFFDWVGKTFWLESYPSSYQPSATLLYPPSSDEEAIVVLGGYDGYLRRLVATASNTGATWTQGTGTDANGGTLDVGAAMGWDSDLVKGQVFEVTIEGVTTAMTCYSSSSSSAKMTVAGPADSGAGNASWLRTSTDDGTAINSYVTYGPFRVAGPGRYGQIVSISADLGTGSRSVAWGIFGGESPQEAVDAAVAAGGDPASANWQGTWTAGMNHRNFPLARGAAFVIVVQGTFGWAIEGLRIESAEAGILI